MLRLFRRLQEDENAVTAIEYGLVAGIISLVIIATVTLVGDKLTNVFNFIGTTLDGTLLN